jgi:hypothetical protein
MRAISNDKSVCKKGEDHARDFNVAAWSRLDCIGITSLRSAGELAERR